YATSLASRRWFVLRGDAGHADQDLCPQYPRRYWDGNLNLSRSRTDGNLRQWPMPRVRHLALPTFRPPFRFATVRTAFLASLHHGHASRSSRWPDEAQLDLAADRLDQFDQREVRALAQEDAPGAQDEPRATGLGDGVPCLSLGFLGRSLLECLPLIE